MVVTVNRKLTNKLGVLPNKQTETPNTAVDTVNTVVSPIPQDTTYQT